MGDGLLLLLFLVGQARGVGVCYVVEPQKLHLDDNWGGGGGGNLTSVFVCLFVVCLLFLGQEVPP